MTRILPKGAANPDSCGLWLHDKTNTLFPTTPCCDALFKFKLKFDGGRYIVCDSCKDFMSEDVTDDYAEGIPIDGWVLGSICRWLDLDERQTIVTIDWN